MSTKAKLDDQTQAALSAIEEALKGTAAPAQPRLPEATSDIIAVRRPTPENRARSAPPPQARPAAAPSASPSPAAPPPAALPAVAETHAPVEPRPRPAPLAPTQAANDDRGDIGALLQTMQAKPSSRPLIMATLASLLWAGAVGWL